MAMQTLIHWILKIQNEKEDPILWKTARDSSILYGPFPQSNL